VTRSDPRHGSAPPPPRMPPPRSVDDHFAPSTPPARSAPPGRFRGPPALAAECRAAIGRFETGSQTPPSMYLHVDDPGEPPSTAPVRLPRKENGHKTEDADICPIIHVV
jgi:hypothetical protein